MPNAAVAGGLRVLLRVEGAFLFAAATFAYALLGSEPWWLYLLFFLAPDLSFLGYLGGARLGAAVYNAAHATIGPVCLGAVGFASGNPAATAIALIWAAHVGLDRSLGYGLKYAAGFGFTHLGPIGRSR
jgi:hypothetical protein